MKRSFSFGRWRVAALLASGTGLIAATYGLVRLAYGLFLPDVRAELSFGSTTAGLISTGASLLYCAGAAIGFLAAARHPRRLVAGATATAALGAAGMAAAQQTAIFAVFAVVGSAGFVPDGEHESPRSGRQLQFSHATPTPSPGAADPDTLDPWR